MLLARAPARRSDSTLRGASVGRLRGWRRGTGESSVGGSLELVGDESDVRVRAGALPDVCSFRP